MKAKKKAKAKSKKAKRWRVWPYTAVRAANGKLYAQCGSCEGTGHPMQWTSRSDTTSADGHRLIKETCNACNGKGYSLSDVITIVEPNK